MGTTVDGRADLFSLGVILYEMVTGRRPFHASTVMAIVLSVAHDCPEPPSQLNPKLPPTLDVVTSKRFEYSTSATAPRGRRTPGRRRASGILAVTGPCAATILCKALAQQNITVTAQGGYLRFAPHFYNTEDQVEQCAHALNALGRS